MFQHPVGYYLFMNSNSMAGELFFNFITHIQQWSIDHSEEEKNVTIANIFCISPNSTYRIKELNADR